MQLWNKSWICSIITLIEELLLRRLLIFEFVTRYSLLAHVHKIQTRWATRLQICTSNLHLTALPLSSNNASFTRSKLCDIIGTTTTWPCSSTNWDFTSQKKQFNPVKYSKLKHFLVFSLTLQDKKLWLKLLRCNVTGLLN